VAVFFPSERRVGCERKRGAIAHKTVDGLQSGEAARRKVDDALRCLADDLKAGKGNSFTAYLAAMSRFRRHSWDNVLLISVQWPNATRVAGHYGWHDLGRAVRAGE
jgi:hypothetical protein